MGNFYQNISASTSLVAAENTWIEGLAIQQLETTSRLAGMQKVVGMPDLHPGRGYPVGAAFFSTGRLYPALVGNDIGCGMGLWQTDMDAAKVHLDKMERRLGNMDGPLGSEWQEDIEQLQLSYPQGHESSLGTIGGGNHFAELQQIETLYHEPARTQLGLHPKKLLLLVHSGSRGLGQTILTDHVTRFGHGGLQQNTPECQEYLERHNNALAFARANRHLIAQRMLNRLGAQGEPLLDAFHNLVEMAEVEGQQGWLHRKGASPATGQAIIIPGSRGDYSYLVAPIAKAESLYSLAHGAGRKWQRNDCRQRLCQRFKIEQLSRTSLGSRVICKDTQLIYEEAPEAYKPIDSVLEALEGAGLVQRLARLKPVLTYKTAGEGKS